MRGSPAFGRGASTRACSSAMSMIPSVLSGRPIQTCTRQAPETRACAARPGMRSPLFPPAAQGCLRRIVHGSRTRQFPREKTGSSSGRIACVWVHAHRRAVDAQRAIVHDAFQLVRRKQLRLNRKTCVFSLFPRQAPPPLPRSLPTSVSRAGIFCEASANANVRADAAVSENHDVAISRHRGPLYSSARRNPPSPWSCRAGVRP